jgi:hydroxyacylglutathione hydrolase
MFLERFEVPGLAHYSYLLSSEGRAVVIDPKRDIDTYVGYALIKGVSITHVLETHIHADYASGATALAQATGAELWLSGHDKDQITDMSFPIIVSAAKRNSVSAICGLWLFIRLAIHQNI